MASTKKVILVVEDDTPMLRVLCDKLTREGFSVLEAKNGEEGLALAVSQKPDLILLDIVMPKKDGVTTLRELRAHSEWGKTVPVIILTNLAEDDRLNKEVTFDEPAFYLVKSDWKIEDVVQKVRERLGAPRRSQ